MSSSARRARSVLVSVNRIPRLFALAVGLSLSLAACGGGDDGGGGDAGGAAGGSTVSIEGFAFKPGSITVPAGTKVTWTNKDSAPHSVQPANNLFPTSPNIEGDTPFEHTYDTAGTFPYVCGIHNYMSGTVVVS